METSAAKRVRERIEQGGSRLWRVTDFRPLPPRAVARELSRLERSGKIFRVRKGVYRNRAGALSVREALSNIAFPVHPARASAAHTLGLAPKPRRAAWATTARSRPPLPGDVLLSRPASRSRLSPEEGAFMEFLRDRGHWAKASDGEVLERSKRFAREHWETLLRAAASEPPRVRAFLGALGEETGQEKRDLWKLRRELNPLTFYRGEVFSHLPSAREWQIR